MPPPTIDTAIFAELQDTAGADFVAELVDTFLDEAPQMLAELRAAQSCRSSPSSPSSASSPLSPSVDAFRRAAHSLKSNSQTFGALPLAELARALELGGLPADATPLAALEAEYARAAAALQGLARG